MYPFYDRAYDTPAADNADAPTPTPNAPTLSLPNTADVPTPTPNEPTLSLPNTALSAAGATAPATNDAGPPKEASASSPPEAASQNTRPRPRLSWVGAVSMAPPNGAALSTSPAAKDAGGFGTDGLSAEELMEMEEDEDADMEE